MDRCDSVPTLSGTLPPCRTGFRTFTRWVPTTTQKLFTYRYFPRPGPSQERLTKQPKRPGTRPSPLPSLIPTPSPGGRRGEPLRFARWFTLGTKAKSRLEGVHSQLFQPEDVRHQNPFPRHDRQKMFVREAGSVEIGQHQAVVRENILYPMPHRFVHKPISFRVRVVGTDDFDLAVQGTQRGDLGQVGHPAQNQMLPAPGATLGKTRSQESPAWR